jgi:hypothetical protein
MEIVLTRDSVHMSDDTNAPHKKAIYIKDVSISGLHKAIREINYLPTVQGNCSWGIIGYGPIGIIVQQWNEVRPLLSGDILLESELERTNNRLHLCCFGNTETKNIEEVLNNYSTVRDY